jgi:hypothetical protein
MIRGDSVRFERCGSPAASMRAARSGVKTKSRGSAAGSEHASRSGPSTARATSSSVAEDAKFFCASASRRASVREMGPSRSEPTGLKSAESPRLQARSRRRKRKAQSALAGTKRCSKATMSATAMSETTATLACRAARSAVTRRVTSTSQR